MLKLLPIAIILVTLASSAQAAQAVGELRFKDEFIKGLVRAIPGILASQDANTGRFGKGIWIVNDQQVMFPLAAAWSIESADNPYYHDAAVLKAVMDAGDALIEDADKDGRWEFRKKDGSTWGKIAQPWTYSRWIRAYSLIKDAMPPDRRERWEKALVHGYTWISKNELKKVHNIPSHHAMGLYVAGMALDRPEWKEQARAFMAKVVAEQDPGGFWSEHFGPVVSYNFVYSDALGVYYALSKDEAVLDALRRASRFHAMFTYPDGAQVETVDERNPYHKSIRTGTVGFSWTPEGRGLVRQQLELQEKAGSRTPTDDLANFLLYGQEGPAEATAAGETDRRSHLEDGSGKPTAMVRRKGPWFVCMSAYCCPVYANRWIQDRQNLVSIYHDSCGVIIGGGNTKLQPLWSNFTVGDPSLLSHKQGDESPKFTPPPGIIHVPSSAALARSGPPVMDLKYGAQACRVAAIPVDDGSLTLTLSAPAFGAEQVEGHVTLLVRPDAPLESGSGQKDLKEPLTLSGAEAGGWIGQGNWRLTVPEDARVQWPVLPHNPYRKDGRAEMSEGRVVVSAQVAPETPHRVFTLSIAD